jgi:hypothetical protein
LLLIKNLYTRKYYNRDIPALPHKNIVEVPNEIDSSDFLKLQEEETAADKRISHIDFK